MNLSFLFNRGEGHFIGVGFRFVDVRRTIPPGQPSHPKEFILFIFSQLNRVYPVKLMLITTQCI